MYDFSPSPEQADVVARVRALMDELVYPNEDRALPHRGLPRELLRTLQRRVKDEGLWAPHMPARGRRAGHGQGHAGPDQRAARSKPDCAARLRHVGAGHRQHGDPVAGRHPGAAAPLPGAAGRRRGALVHRHDRAGGLRLGPDPDPDPGTPRRRRVGHQRPQVVHHQRRLRRLRDRLRGHRSRRSTARARQHVPGRHRHARLRVRARSAGDGRSEPGRSLRAALRRLSRAGGKHAGRRRPGFSAGPAAPGPRPDHPLHALDRRGARAPSS